MAEKQELVCDGCRKTLRIPEKYWGKKVRCPQCSHVLSIPAAPPEPVLDNVELIEEDDPFLDDSPYADEDPYADLPMAPVAAPPRRRTARKKKRKKKSRSVSDDRSAAVSHEEGMFNAGVLGGLGLIVLAAVWFFGGLLAGIIFYYPPIMAIIGVVSIIKGFIGSD